MSTHVPAAETPTPPAARPPARVGKALSRLQGLAALAVLGLVGWELCSLAGLRLEALRFGCDVQDAGGGRVLAFWEAGNRGLSPERAVLARAPVRSFDPERSILILDSGSARIVPRSARTILVDEAGRIEALRAPVPGALLHELARDARGGAIELPVWFRSRGREFPGVDPRVIRLWD
jgi:hypothetical protein